MSFPHQIFRAYDIRGVAERALTLELTERIGRVLGGDTLAHGGGEFVVGRDGRLTSAALAEALQRGVLASGCDVLDIGMAPTPTFYFSTIQYHAGGGAQVTGSHNPPSDNGLKMMLGGVTLCGEAIQDLKRRVMNGDFPARAAGARRGRLRRVDALTAYQRAVVENIGLAKPANLGGERPLKVVLDCGNGVAGVVAPQIFRAIGCQVRELFCEVDGAFPNHHPDPSRPENLQDLIAAVKNQNADFGMAFDGDGDRLGVVSADGGIIWPDRQMMLFAESILAEQPGAEIIFDVKCSQQLPRAITAYGGVATMCKTGHSFIKEKLQRHAAAFAGEMSGHLFFNDRWGGFDDGIYAGARLCELLTRKRGSPGEAFAALPNTINTPELLMQMEEGEPHRLVAEIAAGAHFEDATVSKIDGIRVDFADGFGLLRASNTTAAVSMRFEASNQSQLEMIQDRFRRLLHATRPNLNLPF